MFVNISTSNINVFTLIVFIILFPACYNQQKQVKGIQFIYSLPASMYQEAGVTKIFILTDTISIIYYRDYISYLFLPTVQFETGKNIKGTEPFFLYKKGNINGRFYSSITDSNFIQVKVDSLLAKRAPRGKDFDTPPDSLYKLSEVIANKNNKTLVEKYALVNTWEGKLFDSIYFYYSANIKSIPFSLSEKLDREKGLKLIKAILIYNKSIENADIPKRYFLFEIKNHRPEKLKEFKRIIELKLKQHE